MTAFFCICFILWRNSKPCSLVSQWIRLRDGVSMNQTKRKSCWFFLGKKKSITNPRHIPLSVCHNGNTSSNSTVSDKRPCNVKSHHHDWECVCYIRNSLCSSVLPSVQIMCICVSLEEFSSAFLHLQLLSLPSLYLTSPTAHLPMKDWRQNNLSPYKNNKTEAPLEFTKKAAVEK